MVFFFFLFSRSCSYYLVISRLWSFCYYLPTTNQLIAALYLSNPFNYFLSCTFCLSPFYTGFFYYVRFANDILSSTMNKMSRQTTDTPTSAATTYDEFLNGTVRESVIRAFRLQSCDVMLMLILPRTYKYALPPFPALYFTPS
jgi:hypothetical protein